MLVSKYGVKTELLWGNACQWLLGEDWTPVKECLSMIKGWRLNFCDGMLVSDYVVKTEFLSGNACQWLQGEERTRVRECSSVVMWWRLNSCKGMLVSDYGVTNLLLILASPILPRSPLPLSQPFFFYYCSCQSSHIRDLTRLSHPPSKT